MNYIQVKVLFMKSNSLLMKVPKKVTKYSNEVLVLRYSPAQLKYDNKAFCDIAIFIC